MVYSFTDDGGELSEKEYYFIFLRFCKSLKLTNTALYLITLGLGRKNIYLGGIGVI